MFYKILCFLSDYLPVKLSAKSINVSGLELVEVGWLLSNIGRTVSFKDKMNRFLISNRYLKLKNKKIQPSLL